MRWSGKEKLAYLWKASAGRRKSILLSSGVGTGGVLLSLAFIYVSKWTIDTVTADVPGSLWRPGAWLVGLLALQLLCDVLDGWLSVRLQIDTGNGLRHRLFAHLLYSRWNSLEAFHTGDVVNRIERDVSTIVGNAPCSGHSECDAIIDGTAVVDAAPKLWAHNADAALIHEAAIGKIAGEQILKLRTLGLTEEEAEKKIIEGFLS